MDSSQKITKAVKWRSSLEVECEFDELEFKFKVEPLQPSDEKTAKERKSVRNSREKYKAVKDLMIQMMKILKEKNIPTLEAKIKQLKQEQAVLAQQHQQQLQQNSGFSTQTQQPQSQAQPQQVQVEQSGASACVQTIRVNQQQPQVIQLQPQQQQQQQPQPQVFQLQLQQTQQQQQAQPHHQMQQPGAEAGPPGGIQIVQPIITPTGEIHQITIQLNAEQQLQVIRGQMIGGAGSSQNIVIQTVPIQTQLAQPVQTVQTIQLQGG